MSLVYHATYRCMPTTRSRRRGFGILDTFLSLSLAAVALAGYFQNQNDRYARDQMMIMSDTLKFIGNASMSYVKANNTTLLENLQVNQSEVVPLNGTTSLASGTLEEGGYLPTEFTPHLPYHQQLALLLKHVPVNGTIPEHIQAMLVSYGGDEIPDRYLGQAALHSLGNAGFIPNYDVTGRSNTIIGVNGLWSSPVSDWSSAGISLESGHMMYDVTPMYSSLSPWMDRYNIGIQDANTMHTTLYMDNNSINDISSINAVTGDDVYIHSTAGGDTSNSVTNNRLIIYGGGEACVGNLSDCQMQISDDGGFYDPNNGWITFFGPTAGIKNNGQLNVEGSATLYGDATVAGNVTLGSSSTSGTATFYGASNSSVGDTDFESNLALAEDSNGGFWMDLTGGSGFQGLAANLIGAAEGFVSNSNSTYVVSPATTSYFNYVSMVESWISGNATIVGQLTASYDVGSLGNVTAGNFIGTNGYTEADGPYGSLTSGLITNTLTTSSDFSVGGDSGGVAGGAPITVTTDGATNYQGLLTNTSQTQIGQSMDVQTGDVKIQNGNLTVQNGLYLGQGVAAGGEITQNGDARVYGWAVVSGELSAYGTNAVIGAGCSYPGEWSFTAGYGALSVCTSNYEWKKVATDN